MNRGIRGVASGRCRKAIMSYVRMEVSGVSRGSQAVHITIPFTVSGVTSRGGHRLGNRILVIEGIWR